VLSSCGYKASSWTALAHIFVLLRFVCTFFVGGGGNSLISSLKGCVVGTEFFFFQIFYFGLLFF